MTLHFMKYRKLSYWISAALVVLSIISLAVKGLNYGIDFAGGIAMEVKPISADYTLDKMRSDLADFKPELQEDTKGNVLVRIGLEKDATEDQQNKAVANIKNIFGDRVIIKFKLLVQKRWRINSGGMRYIIFIYFDGILYMDWKYKGRYAIGSLVS